MNKLNVTRNIAPALTLMVLAPLIAEVLPGATRFSSLFVFPIEVCIWGGGALLIRYAVRKLQLGWLNMLFLALALSLAEEFLIQQTSIAPMVLQIKGITYARAWGVNYVYLVWALIYETVLVVFVPVYLTELIFQSRREDLWINKWGVAAISLLFVPGSFMAWYSWTQIARPKVFHVPAYTPPFLFLFIAITTIVALLIIALGPLRNRFSIKPKPLQPPPSWLLMITGALWATLLFGIVLLAFGILPSFPPAIPIGTGLFLAASALYFLPRWTSSLSWHPNHTFAVIFGISSGSMLAGFIGFIGAVPIDLYFKIVINTIAIALLIMLGLRIQKHYRQ